MRDAIKAVCNWLALVAVFPFAACCWIERRLGITGDRSFGFFAHTLALAPGVLGVFLRRAFYRMTLEYCSWDCKISFGAVLSDHRTRVESGVYIGLYAIIGSARLGRDCLIGSRASIVNGPLHVLQEDGKWSPARTEEITPVQIGDDAWLGEGVIVLSDVGIGAVVAAGSVVSQSVPPRIVVAGNPARFIRRLEPGNAESNGES